jgi:hypothetical protein
MAHRLRPNAAKVLPAAVSGLVFMLIVDEFG